MSEPNIVQKCHDIAQEVVKSGSAYQDAFELEMALRAIAIHKPKIILEIGIANAASLASWAAVCEPELVIGIDPMNNPKHAGWQEALDRRIAENNIKIIPHISRLEITHEALKGILNERKVDFLFIDAEHKYDDVRHDFYKYLPYMAPGGIVGFHDIFYSDEIFDSGSQAGFFWERMKREYKIWDEFQFHSTMGIGLVYLP